nr:VCBS repeat-containing protein [Terriglobales bacterium]
MFLSKFFRTLASLASLVCVAAALPVPRFRESKLYPIGHLGDSLAIADFNGDGVPDIATANGDDNSVSVLLGVGSGFRSHVDYTLASQAIDIQTGDFNRDGNVDLVIASCYPGALSILLGNGDGTFQPASSHDMSVRPDSIAVGDLNGDGNPDLAILD